MKAKALTVHWHQDNQPIYSAHFQPSPSGVPKRLATCGGDNNVRLWKLEHQDAESPTTVTLVNYLATLSKHTQAVNVVRFDPKGNILASAGDDGIIFLWSLAPSNNQSNIKQKGFGQDDDDVEDKETWKLRLSCRSALAEIYDLAWSPDSQYLLTGSMDNIARVYNASTGQCIRELAEHSGYIQGVCFDPLSCFIATQSSDRSVHIYNLKTKDGQFVLSNHHKITKAELPIKKPKDLNPPTSNNNSTSSPSYTSSGSSAIPPTPSADSEPSPSTPATPTSHSMNPPSIKPSHSRKSSFGSSSRPSSPTPSFIPLPAVRHIESPMARSAFLYHNETFTSFFRRLSFTPDGSLLLTPSGVYKYSSNDDGNDQTTNTVYIYSRAGLNRPPIAHLPGLKKPSLAVSCSPIFYKLRNQPLKTQIISLNSSSSETNMPISETSSDSGKSINNNDKPIFKLKYRMVYAVITQDSVIVYDTEQRQPLCIVSNLNYSSFTDITWSPDGNNLIATSTDGFCSVIMFEPGELGERYTDPVQPPLTSTNTVTPSLLGSPRPFNSPKKRQANLMVPPLSSNPATSSAAALASVTNSLSAGYSSSTTHSSNSSRAGSPALMTPSSVLSSSEPPVPIVTSVPSIVTQNNAPNNSNSSYSTPPQTPTPQATSSASEGNSSAQQSQQPPKKKKRRIVPTLVNPNP